MFFLVLGVTLAKKKDRRFDRTKKLRWTLQKQGRQEVLSQKLLSFDASSSSSDRNSLHIRSGIDVK